MRLSLLAIFPMVLLACATPRPPDLSLHERVALQAELAEGAVCETGPVPQEPEQSGLAGVVTAVVGVATAMRTQSELERCNQAFALGLPANHVTEFVADQAAVVLGDRVHLQPVARDRASPVTLTVRVVHWGAVGRVAHVRVLARATSDNGVELWKHEAAAQQSLPDVAYEGSPREMATAVDALIGETVKAALAPLVPAP